MIGSAERVLVSHFVMSAYGGFGLLVRLPQHTNPNLAEVAADFVARARDRGPAGPR